MRALVTDKKLATLTNGTPDVASFTPQLTAYYNYYPFGMLQPGRYGPGNGTFSPTGYRFGYNGKEKDNNGEIGLTNYNYGARIYNPAVGRFLSVDPLTKEYPMWNPYVYAGNNPTRYVDINEKGPGDMFKSPKEAALDFGKTYNDNSIGIKAEYATTIIK